MIPYGITGSERVNTVILAVLTKNKKKGLKLRTIIIITILFFCNQ